MANGIFYCIPQWMTSELVDRCCKKCGVNIRKKDIIAVGIRESSKKNAMYVEHRCSKCKEREITSFYKANGTVEDLCYTLLDCIKQRKAIHKAQEVEGAHSEGSKISDAEVKSFIEFIQNADSHEEFMKHIQADKYQGIDDEPREDES